MIVVVESLAAESPVPAMDPGMPKSLLLEDSVREAIAVTGALATDDAIGQVVDCMMQRACKGVTNATN
jgi:hypothetical protein